LEGGAAVALAILSGAVAAIIVIVLGASIGIHTLGESWLSEAKMWFPEDDRKDKEK